MPGPAPAGAAPSARASTPTVAPVLAPTVAPTIRELTLREALTGCAFSPDGRVLATTSVHRAVLWSTDTWTALRSLDEHRRELTGCDFSRDGAFLATSSLDRTAKIWSLESFACVNTLPHDRSVTSCSWGVGRSLVTSTTGGTATIWRLGEQPGQHSVVESLRISQGPSWCARLSADGRLLATASYDGTTKIWAATDGRWCCVTRLEGECCVNSVAFSPGTGARLVTVDDRNSLRMWDSASGNLLSITPAHNAVITSCAWSPDGQLLATTSRDRTARLWDTSLSFRSLDHRASVVKACAFSPDGRLLATVGEDGKILLATLPAHPLKILLLILAARRLRLRHPPADVWAAICNRFLTHLPPTPWKRLN